MGTSYVYSEIQTSGGIYLHVIHCLYYLPLQLLSIMLLKPETDQKIYKTRMQDCASVQNWSIYNHLQLGLDRASVVSS